MVVAYTIGRIIIPLLFIVSGIQKALNVGEFAKVLASYNVPIPEEIASYLGGIPKYEALGYAIAAIEIICGLMVLIGLKARWAALVLIVFTACTIIYDYHFWDMNAAEFVRNQTEALKYLSIIGGLLMVVAIGSGPGAMDRRD
jgi:putative oxidoreductase